MILERHNIKNKDTLIIQIIFCMKKLFVVFTFLVGLSFSFYGYSQDSIKTKKMESPNAVFFAPFNLFDWVNPNFQIGYERFLAKKWAVQIEAGIIISHSIENCIVDWITGLKVKDCPYINKGFRIKTSVKYIVLDKRKIKLYVSPEFFYLKNKSGIVRDFLISDHDFEYSIGKAPEGMDMFKQFFFNDEEKMGVNFKIGIKLLFGKRFFLEPNVGLGFAYRNVIQTGIENPNDKVYGFWQDLDLEFFDQVAPNKWVITMPFNLKIGIRF